LHDGASRSRPKKTPTTRRLGAKFYISNGSDADIRIRYGASAIPGSGILLKPGNTLEEDRYAGEVSGVPETPGVVKFVGVTIV
jgi:hypothetical protein